MFRGELASHLQMVVTSSNAQCAYVEITAHPASGKNKWKFTCLKNNNDALVNNTDTLHCQKNANLILWRHWSCSCIYYRMPGGVSAARWLLLPVRSARTGPTEGRSNLATGRCKCQMHSRLPVHHRPLRGQAETVTHQSDHALRLFSCSVSGWFGQTPANWRRSGMRLSSISWWTSFGLL